VATPAAASDVDRMNVLRETLCEKAMATFLIAPSAGFVQTISALNPHFLFEVRVSGRMIGSTPVFMQL
jgi:hypothetical protein